MNWADWLIVGILAVSGIIGAVRGLVREVLALAVWAAAVWVGLQYSKELSVYFHDQIDVPSLRLVAAFAVLFVATVILGSLLTFLLGQLVSTSGLSGSDRLLGLVFGLARGAVLVAALVFAAGLTPLPHDPWWQQSGLIPPFQRLALWLKDQLPTDGVARYLKF